MLERQVDEIGAQVEAWHRDNELSGEEVGGHRWARRTGFPGGRRGCALPPVAAPPFQAKPLCRN
jgi:hypothetical protein